MTDLSSMSDDDLRAAHAATSLSHMSDDELRAAHAASARSSPSAFESGMLGAVDTAGFGLGPAISGLTAASGMTPTRGYENQPHLDPNPLMPLVGAGRMINEKLIKPLTGGQPNDEVGQAYDRGRQSALDAINQAKQAHPNAYLAGQVGGAFAAPGFGVAGGATTAARIARGAGAGAIGGGLYGAGEAIGQGESPGETALAAGRGALTGAPLGAAGAGVTEALAPAAGRVANVIRGIKNPEEEASRRIATAMTRDWQSQGPSLTAEEIAAANAAGLPRSVIDAGGETTRALARSAANTSPEARAALAEMARDRFEDQSPRIAAFIRDITGGANAGADLETLQAAARRANQPAYKAAYAAGSGGVWTPELERLAGAPAVRQAMQDAVQRGRDRAVSEGLGAFNPGVTFENGVMQFGRGKGAPPYPDIQFWDYVQRELRDSANVAKRSGRNEEYGAITGLRRRLLGELDTQVPEFATARNGAAQFLGADNALEAGEKFVNFRPGGRNEMDFRKTYARMSQPERELFTRGYASKLASNIEAVADNRSVLNAAFVNSGPARQRTLLALGPQRAAQLEALLRAEKITDLARQNMGNSSTARQLVELGLAGGSEGVLKQNFNLSHILVEAFRGAVRHGAQVIDGRVAERVGQMLASSDPNVLRQGLQLVARQPRLLNALRQASNRLGYAATAATQPQQGFKHGGAVDSTTERKPPHLSTRKQSNYSPTAGTKARHCANCAHYLKPNKCSEVGGFIAARGLCEWYRGQRAAGGRVDASNINHAPTEAQKEAGNYAKDHVRIHGLDIAIENAKGAERSGVGKDGKPWSVRMPAHYGYIKRTEGADGDHVDVYLGPHTKSRKVFVVDQRDAETSDFDEHKVMMGFGTQKQAREAYHRGFSDGRGRERLGHMTEMGVDEFKGWLKHGNQSRPAFADGGALSDDDIASMTHQAEQPNPVAPIVDFGKRIGAHFANKLASAVTAPRDALYGTMQVTDPETGMPTREAMERGQGVANMAMTGGIPFAQRGAAGMAGGKLARGEAKAVESPVMAATEYRGEHGAPDADSGSPLHDVTANGTYPKDFYGPNGLRYYAAGHEGTLDADTYRKIFMLKDKPDAMVPVWRAMPWEGKGKDPVTRSGSNINPGDWVAISRQYALDHGESALNGNYSLAKKMVPARELFTAGDSFHEWGWSPKEATEKPAGTLSDFITAYHGSPHDFDRFDLSKIGTGEGAQAYGHGLYFAENEGVAKGYRDTLTATRIPDAAYLDPDLGPKLTASEQRMKDINNQIMEARFAGKNEQSINKLRGELDKATNDHLDLIEQTKFPGRMYQVAIKADPEHFLDWDKPLSEQHPAALEKLKTVVRPDPGRTVADWIQHSPGAEQRLREAGIPGIKYLDQGSRGKGDGTRNYVVFSDDIVQILKKYGLAGLIAGGAAHFSDRDLSGSK